MSLTRDEKHRINRAAHDFLNKMQVDLRRRMISLAESTVENGGSDALESLIESFEMGDMHGCDHE